MQLPKAYVLVGVFIALIVVGVVGILTLQPPSDLLPKAEISIETISPNADGDSDLAVLSYSLSRNANVSIIFENEANDIFYFREAEPRSEGDYSVQFSGVVDGYVLPDETIDGTVERRLIPNGSYTWTIRATDDEGDTQSRTGKLTITDADTELPLITGFDLSSTIFTPNQDGVRDRIRVNVFLAKASDLKVFLEDQKGAQIFLGERLLGREPGEPGNHEYDYDGGVDDGYEPPADGNYALYAVAQDAVGQRISRQKTITIDNGGLPQMEIIAQSTGATVCFSRLPWDEKYANDLNTIGEKIAPPDSSCSSNATLTLEEGDLLVFTLTIRNYGRTEVRTIGPFPGTVYQFNQQSNSLGYLEEDGAFRIGIDCATTLSNYPWRWAIGDLNVLRTVEDEELGDTFYYLDANENNDVQAVVWGAIRMTEIFEARNPQNCWAGLIHEGVNVDPFQNQVGVRQIKLVPKGELGLEDRPEVSNALFGG